MINCKISELPIKPVKIAKTYDLECRKATDIFLNGDSGQILRDEENREIIIFTNKDNCNQRRRYWSIVNKVDRKIKKAFQIEQEIKCRLTRKIQKNTVLRLKKQP